MPKNDLTDQDIERLLKNEGDLSDLFDRCARNPELLNDVILIADLAHGITRRDLDRAEVHPQPGILARYQLSQASLDPPQRDQIAEHLRTCGVCSAELAALAKFDFAKLPRPALAQPHSTGRSPEAVATHAATRKRPQQAAPRTSVGGWFPRSIGFRYGLVSAASLALGALIAVLLMQPSGAIRLAIDTDNEVANARSGTAHVMLTGASPSRSESTLAEVCPTGHLVCSCSP